MGATSLMSVCAARLDVRSVGVLPPSGPTDTGRPSRVPSLEETTTTTPESTMEASVSRITGSSSSHRAGKPIEPSVPKPRLAVMTSGRGFCAAAAFRAAAMPSLDGSWGMTSRYCAPGAMPSRSVAPLPVFSGRCRSCGSGDIIEKSSSTSARLGSWPSVDPVGSK